MQSRFAREPDIEIWCNGSTTDSGSVSEGSSPSISTRYNDNQRKCEIRIVSFADTFQIISLKTPWGNDGGVAQLVRASDS